MHRLNKMRGVSPLPLMLVLSASVLAAGCSHDRFSEQETTSAEQTYQLCVSCHGPAAGGNAEFKAPAIAGLPDWYIENSLRKFKSGARGTHAADITGMSMRPMAMSIRNEADLKAIAAYVSRLPKVDPAPSVEGGNAAAGQAHYAVCAACHGAAGEGNPQLKAPPLNHASDWYMIGQLEKFKIGARGTNPKDIEGAQMRPNALALADEQAMKDVVAHIMTLK